MKSTILPIAMITATVFINLSCSKKSGSSSSCKLITMTEVDGGSTYISNITYNNDGKVATIVSSGGSSTTTTVFTYAGNVIMKTATSSGGGNPTTDSIALNSAGYIIADMTRYGPASYSYATYTYDGNNQLLKSVSQSNGGTPSTSLVTYSGGDLSYIVNGGTDTTYLYYNMNKASGADYISVLQQVQYGGGLVFKMAHQLKALKNPGSNIQNFDYTYDSKGNLSEMAITSGSDIAHYSLQYDCGTN